MRGEVGEMATELIVGVACLIVRLMDSTPRVAELGQPMFDPVFSANAIECAPESLVVRPHRWFSVGELDSIVGEHHANRLSTAVAATTKESRNVRVLVLPILRRRRILQVPSTATNRSGLLCAI
jgi:hypothetical protein